METSGIGFGVFSLTVWIVNFAILNVGLVIAVKERRLIRAIFIFLGLLTVAAIIVYLSVVLYAQIVACK